MYDVADFLDNYLEEKKSILEINFVNNKPADPHGWGFTASGIFGLRFFFRIILSFLTWTFKRIYVRYNKTDHYRCIHIFLI